jgi:hypothetical protein
MSQVASGGAPILESRWYEDEWQHCSEIRYYLHAKAFNFLNAELQTTERDCLGGECLLFDNRAKMH